MNFLNKLPIFILLVCIGFQLQATSIVPFPNLGKMAIASEAVVMVKVLNNFEYPDGESTYFRTRLQVLQKIKGRLDVGDQFIVQNLHLKIGDLERSIWGDLEMVEGKTYFLFLDYNNNGYWQPKMLSFAAFEEMTRDGQQVLVPFDLGSEVQILTGSDGIAREPLKVYKSNAMVSLLQEVVSGVAQWDSKHVATRYEIDSFATAASTRAAVNPGHCTHLTNNPIARWDKFETATNLPVYYAATGDPGCSTVGTKIQGAISTMNSQYTSIKLSYGGTHSFVPDCNTGAVGSQFTNWVSSSTIGERSLVIQFNDPCSEIADLSGCSGTLAVGGLYVYSSTYVWNGSTWGKAAFGYVIVNNGTGTCQCNSGSDYEMMMTHEMTHSLNVGHIATSFGTANMNPSCCNAIQSLDISCLGYMYSAIQLPVELIDFDGNLRQQAVELRWETSSELNNDFFTLERSYDGLHFEKINTIPAKRNSSTQQLYTYTDDTPLLGQSYYRLSQTDYDGKTEILGKLVSINYQSNKDIAIQPNPVHSNQLQLIYQSTDADDLDIVIYNVMGKQVKQIAVQTNTGQNIFSLDITGLPNGLYVIKTNQGNHVQSVRFVKTND